MHTFDLNLRPDWVEEEDEEERKLSAEALGSSDEELNGFIDYFLHGSDSDVSQSNQSRPEEWISRGGRVSISRNEGMDLDLNLDLDFTELGNRGTTTSLMESGESSSSSSMRDVELVCEEDFRFLVNESNTNKEAPFDLNEVPFDLNVGLIDEANTHNDNVNQGDAMMVDSEEGLGMMINAADDDGDDRLYSWNDFYNDMVEDVLEQYDDGDEWLPPWNNYFHPDILEVDLEQFWIDFDAYFYSSNMQTVTCDVDNLPSVTLTQEELNHSNSICAICMENFCIEEKLKRLPCFHYYHVDCISPWLRTRNTCPTCRYEVPIIS